MKLGRFQAILDAYGASPERWPERERADALALSRSSLVAARALASARALDGALDALAQTADPIGDAQMRALQARIIAAATPLARSRAPGLGFKPALLGWLGLDLTPAQLWPSLAGLSFMTALGFAVGLNGLIDNPTAESDDSVTVSSIDFVLSGPSP